MRPKRKDNSTPEVDSMDRERLVGEVLSLKCEFPLDFTPQYLKSLPLKKLRHLYMALRPHSRSQQRRPSK